MLWLKKKARQELNTLLAYDKTKYKTKICVTHYPPYTRDPKYQEMIADPTYLPLICSDFNYLMVGHSHSDEEWNFKGCQILNCGNDYDKCQIKILDLSTSSVTTIGED